jgi:F-type H+-transporting ATPase subunit delta
MSAIASRYSRALADVVVERKLDATATAQDLDALADTFKNSAELRTLFENPAVPGEQKLKLLDALTSRMATAKEVRNFVAILIEKRRAGLLSEIAEQFKIEINDRLGFADAEIVSARALDADERAVIEQKVSAETGKKVRARYRQDAFLLGGVRVKVGSTIYDGSVRGELDRMKMALAQ